MFNTTRKIELLDEVSALEAAIKDMQRCMHGAHGCERHDLEQDMYKCKSAMATAMAELHDLATE